jgi:LysM repeat protein
MAEAYVCLQRVLSINPNNQKAQRGVERIRTKMAGEEGPEEASTPPPNSTSEAKAPTPTSTHEATAISEPDYSENAEMEAIEDSGYNPPATDFAVVSGLDSAGADFLQYSKQGSEQNEANFGFSSNYAQASGYPYPTEEEPAANSNFANVAPAFSNNDVYTPVDINSYQPVAPQIQPQYEQNHFYQPQPIEENQNRFYQPQPTEEYRSPQSGSYDNSAMSFANTAREYQPANYQAAPNNPMPSYQSNPTQPDQLPDFLTLRDEGQATGPNGAGNPKNKRNNFKVVKVNTPKAPKPKGSGFSLKNLGRREEAPLIATFGTEDATDLDEVGLSRKKNVQRRAMAILVGLVIVVVIILVAIFVFRGRANDIQQAANPTDIVPPPSTTSIEGNPTDSSGTPGASMTTISSDNGTATANPTTTDPNGTNSNATTTVDVATTSAAPTTQATTTVAPANTTAPQATTTNVPASNSTLKPIVYTIASGDNLTKVSQKFGTTIDAIIAANKPAVISPSRIYAGQKIIIPVSRTTFTGKGGIITGPNDTIASVAAKYNVKPEDLLKFNGLTDASQFKPGDALLIP